MIIPFPSGDGARTTRSLCRVGSDAIRALNIRIARTHLCEPCRPRPRTPSIFREGPEGGSAPLERCVSAFAVRAPSSCTARCSEAPLVLLVVSVSRDGSCAATHVSALVSLGRVISGLPFGAAPEARLRSACVEQRDRRVALRQCDFEMADALLLGRCQPQACRPSGRSHTHAISTPSVELRSSFLWSSRSCEPFQPCRHMLRRPTSVNRRQVTSMAAKGGSG